MDAVDLLARRFGGQEAAAKALGLTISALSYWRKRGVPVRHIRLVSELTGLSPQDLRPDLFPKPKTEAA